MPRRSQLTLSQLSLPRLALVALLLTGVRSAPGILISPTSRLLCRTVNSAVSIHFAPIRKFFIRTVSRPVTILSIAIFPHHVRRDVRETRSLTYKLSIDEIIHSLSCYSVGNIVYEDINVYIRYLRIYIYIYQRRS